MYTFKVWVPNGSEGAKGREVLLAGSGGELAKLQ